MSLHSSLPPFFRPQTVPLSLHPSFRPPSLFMNIMHVDKLLKCPLYKILAMALPACLSPSLPAYLPPFLPNSLPLSMKMALASSFPPSLPATLPWTYYQDKCWKINVRKKPECKLK